MRKKESVELKYMRDTRWQDRGEYHEGKHKHKSRHDVRKQKPSKHKRKLQKHTSEHLTINHQSKDLKPLKVKDEINKKLQTQATQNRTQNTNS